MNHRQESQDASQTGPEPDRVGAPDETPACAGAPQDPADVVPFGRLPAVVRRRADLSSAAKVLYSFWLYRWQMNHRQPFRSRRDTERAETGLGRDQQTAARRSLVKSGLARLRSTGRSRLVSLLPIEADAPGSRVSDERETHASDARESRTSTVQSTSVDHPEDCTVPGENASRPRDTDIEQQGRRMLDTAEGHDLLRLLESLGFNMGSEANLQALYRRVVQFETELDGGENPVEFLRWELDRIARRRTAHGEPITDEDRTRIAASLIHKGFQYDWEDVLRRFRDHEDEEVRV